MKFIVKDPIFYSLDCFAFIYLTFLTTFKTNNFEFIKKFI